MLPDQDLIIQIRKRDAQAFETLFERYGKTIHRYLLNIVRSDAAAQDLVQEVFLRVWTCADQWDGRGPVKAWLYRIATNQAFNHLRSLRRRPEQPLEPTARLPDDEDDSVFPAWMADSSALGPDIAVELAERNERLRRLIDELPEDKRAVFHLVHQREMSIRDAADELGIPEGTVKSRLHYAKEWLSQELQEPEMKQEKVK